MKEIIKRNKKNKKKRIEITVKEKDLGAKI